MTSEREGSRSLMLQNPHILMAIIIALLVFVATLVLITSLGDFTPAAQPLARLSQEVLRGFYVVAAVYVVILLHFLITTPLRFLTQSREDYVFTVFSLLCAMGFFYLDATMLPIIILEDQHYETCRAFESDFTLTQRIRHEGGKSPAMHYRLVFTDVSGASFDVTATRADYEAAQPGTRMHVWGTKSFYGTVLTRWAPLPQP